MPIVIARRVDAVIMLAPGEYRSVADACDFDAVFCVVSPAHDIEDHQTSFVDLPGLCIRLMSLRQPTTAPSDINFFISASFPPSSPSMSLNFERSTSQLAIQD